VYTEEPTGVKTVAARLDHPALEYLVLGLSCFDFSTNACRIEVGNTPVFASKADVPTADSKTARMLTARAIVALALPWSLDTTEDLMYCTTDVIGWIRTRIFALLGVSGKDPCFTVQTERYFSGISDAGTLHYYRGTVPYCTGACFSRLLHNIQSPVLD